MRLSPLPYWPRCLAWEAAGDDWAVGRRTPSQHPLRNQSYAFEFGFNFFAFTPKSYTLLYMYNHSPNRLESHSVLEGFFSSPGSSLGKIKPVGYITHTYKFVGPCINIPASIPAKLLKPKSYPRLSAITPPPAPRPSAWPCWRTGRYSSRTLDRPPSEVAIWEYVLCLLITIHYHRVTSSITLAIAAIGGAWPSRCCDVLFRSRLLPSPQVLASLTKIGTVGG
ncbi:hypothetical protein BZA05DRAFT_387470 [Tricharina praecox]|uniref:uncharacterized protein n=1 Tax=Tricharina praecox TaxID=43433 RepID=UPI0022203AE5|nr:uncharacterized protein BZA05DRAFT_387470 [Tricharina praecox]KAI5857174.1 hypothetical protein BZA05DRAFT_387470 [Tricharina praecox]